MTAFLGALTYLGSPLITRVGDKPPFPGARLVVVPAPFFPHRLAKGYGNPTWQVVKKVNRQGVKNLARLVQLLRDLQKPFVSFEFDTRAGGEAFIFPRAEMVAATDGILTDSGIRSQASPDLFKIWSSKPQ